MKAAPTWRWVTYTWIDDPSIWRYAIWSARSRSTPPMHGTRLTSASCSLLSVGQKKGLERLLGARRIDPYFAPRWYWPSLGTAQFMLRRYADALADYDRAIASANDLAIMAGCCAKLGLSDRARELMTRCLTAQPELTVGTLVAKNSFKNASDREHLAECVRLAGLPE